MKMGIRLLKWEEFGTKKTVHAHLILLIFTYFTLFFLYGGLNSSGNNKTVKMS